MSRAQTNADGSLNLHGKRYYTVALRVAAFRKAHPISEGWGLLSEMVHADAETLLFKATIVDPTGRVVAVGYAEEKRTNRGINATSALEVCETSALGRALAAAGYGGDGAYSSADELVNALNQQGKQAANRTPPKTRTPGQGTGRTASVSAAPSPKHHPSWDRGHKPFLAELKQRGLEYQAVAAYCEKHKWGRPATWATDERTRFLDDLDQGTFKDLYDPAAQAQAEGAAPAADQAPSERRAG